MSKKIKHTLILRIFSLLLLLKSFNSFAQEKEDGKYFSIGGYGIGYPTRYESHIFIGGLVDVSLKNYQRLCSSSSLNYLTLFNQYNYYQNFSITSGLSWSLQNKVLCFRPGIQFGYLFQGREKTIHDYTFQGVLGRVSSELTYMFNRMEFGIHFNIGLGYGPTIYYYGDIISSKQYLLGGTAGLGIELKYRIDK